MTALIKANPQLPAAIAKLVALATPEVMNELAGGVTSGFPIIGYKGKVWRIRKKGEESLHLDADGNAMPFIDVVLIKAMPNMSKIYYDKQYVEGSNEAPRCFSNDGVRPDASVISPINPVCATCPNNVWGSKITEAGKKARACSDARRMAVAFADDLYQNGTDCQKFLLRVPPASLNPLKDYAEKMLAPKGIPFFAIVSRVGFDPQVAHPQFTFKPNRFLNEEEAETVLALREDPDVQRILAEATEFPAPGAGVAAGESEASADAPAPVQAAATPTTPGAAKPATKAKAAPRPATDEEAGDAAAQASAPAPAARTTPKPAPQPAAPAVEELGAAPPPRKPRKAAAAASSPAAVAPVEAAAPVEEEEASPAVAAGKVPADFDNLLDSILNG